MGDGAVDNVWLDSMSWNLDFYGRGLQVNRWPFSEVVSNLTRIAALVDEKPPRVLEIGSGTGNNLRFVAESGWFGVGIDTSSVGLKIAKQFLGELSMPARLAVASFENLPFGDASFDIVFDRGALIHATDSGLDRAMSEIERVLARGGFFLSLGLRSSRHPASPDAARSTFGTSAGRPLSFLTRCRVADSVDCFADFRIRSRALFSDDALIDEEFEIIARKETPLPVTVLKGWT